jgi:hypothetical protein
MSGPFGRSERKCKNQMIPEDRVCSAVEFLTKYKNWCSMIKIHCHINLRATIAKSPLIEIGIVGYGRTAHSSASD